MSFEPLIGTHFDANLDTYNNEEIERIAARLYFQTLYSTQATNRPTYVARMLHAAYGIPQDTAYESLSRFFHVNFDDQGARVKSEIVALLVNQQRPLIDR